MFETAIRPDIEDSTAIQIERVLRKAIINLSLKPGSRLSEADLAASFGVSRQPVREALIALGKSRLIEIRPNRGTVVVKISARDMSEARFVREAVEVGVVERACDSFDPWSRQRIGTLLDLQRAASRAGDHEAFSALDRDFHVEISQGAGCTLAWEAIADMKSHMDRVCSLLLRDEASMNVLIAEHSDIIDAIDAKDAVRARASMKHHLTGILRDLPSLEAKFPDLFG